MTLTIFLILNSWVLMFLLNFLTCFCLTITKWWRICASIEWISISKFFECTNSWFESCTNSWFESYTNSWFKSCSTSLSLNFVSSRRSKVFVRNSKSKIAEKFKKDSTKSFIKFVIRMLNMNWSTKRSTRKEFEINEIDSLSSLRSKV